MEEGPGGGRIVSHGQTASSPPFLYPEVKTDDLSIHKHGGGAVWLQETREGREVRLICVEEP